MKSRDSNLDKFRKDVAEELGQDLSPELQAQLEQDDEALTRLAHLENRDPSRLRHLAQQAISQHQRDFKRRRWFSPISVAALFLIGLALILWQLPSHSVPSRHYSWSTLQGEVEASSTEKWAQDKLMAGDFLATTEDSQAQLKVADLGTVVIEPNSKLHVLEIGDGLHHLMLERGTIQVAIDGREREFQVKTPAAQVVDLGCAYTLTVHKDQATTLHVHEGQVSLESEHERDAYVPAGASCQAHQETGPSVPVWKDAHSVFHTFAQKEVFKEHSSAEIDRLLEHSTKRDVLTLWHLLKVPNKDTRQRVFERLIQLSPLPPNMLEDEILNLNQRALNAWLTDLKRHFSYNDLK